MSKKIHQHAIEMLKADDENNFEKFTTLYADLERLCVEGEADEQVNHPIQWEALADFTGDDDKALTIYLKALALAEKSGEHSYVASTSFAIAQIFQEKNDIDQAVVMAKKARDSALLIDDKELQKEIRALFKSFKNTEAE